MSLKTFLEKIWIQIKNLFNAVPSEIKSAVQAGVYLTENIKNFIDSPEVDVLTALIPGNIDDVIKNKLRQALPILLTELKLVNSTLGLTEPADIVANAIKTLNGLSDVIKPGVLHQLSILIAQVAADGQLSWSDAVYLLQWYYQHSVKTTTE